jgi:hypothetical protein
MVKYSLLTALLLSVPTALLLSVLFRTMWFSSGLFSTGLFSLPMLVMTQRDNNPIVGHES